MNLESSPAGATFTLYFPAVDLSSDKPINYKDGSSCPLPSRGETILVVDDEPEQLRLCSTILTRLGYRAFTAQSGEEALKLASQQYFDLILLDIVMPHGMDGLQTYVELRRVQSQQKVILCSGYLREEEVNKATSLGMKRFLHKPYTIDALARVVSMELHSKS